MADSDIFELRGNATEGYSLWLKDVTLDYEDARTHRATISLDATGTGDAPEDVTFTLSATNRPTTISLGDASKSLAEGSLSYFGAIQSLDSPLLISGHFGAGTGIVGIAFNTIIENATGGDGDDVLIANEVANRLDGGEGQDAASYEASDEAVSVDLSNGNPEAGGTAQGDRLINIENLIGSAFDDTLTGDAGDNHLIGRDGDDTLKGGNGDDTLYGEYGNDWLYSGDGNDKLYGGEDDDNLIGDGGDLNILDGGAGNDNIFADSGRAIMTGGTGSDIFAISHIGSTIENACVITDFSLNDFDWLDLSPYLDAIWIDRSQSVDTGLDSNNSTRAYTVIYGNEAGTEVVVILEDFNDRDLFLAISDATIALNDFEVAIL